MKILKSRVLWLIILTAPFLMASQCGTPKFPGGIRVYATEAPLENPGAGIGIGGVADTGEWLYWNQTAQQSHGTQYSFAGETDFEGIDDHPNAADNSVWLIGADFTEATGGVCTATDGTETVPPGGGTVPAICLLPPD